MADYLYRVRITAYPEGASRRDHYSESEELDRWVPVRGWAPPGWKPEGNYVKMLGTTEFVWPSTSKVYRSRSAVKKRADLLESFGATVVIERSLKVFWPSELSEPGLDCACDADRSGEGGGRPHPTVSAIRELRDEAESLELVHKLRTLQVRSRQWTVS